MEVAHMNHFVDLLIPNKKHKNVVQIWIGNKMISKKGFSNDVVQMYLMKQQ